MPEVSFRDFAAAVMTNDMAAAAQVLQMLLALDETGAGAAAAHFQRRMAEEGQPFMMVAMGLRTAVTSGSDQEMGDLLARCFGLAGDDLASAVRALRRRYP